jgi:hypothetical protein
MKGIEFRKWIEAGFKDYGKEPWYFIRELAQNSRDAGAHTIRVTAGRTTQENEILVFEDDGCGMTYDHAAKYLFRLYASSKANEKYAAGMFGIGFWTVLKFNPQKIIIESNNGSETWAVLVDADLNTTPIACHLKDKGTRITLIRPPVEKTAGLFVKKTEEALVRYCSYLRRNTRYAQPLPVLFGEQNITKELSLPGPVTLSFQKGPVEGVVGLAPLPEVRLYARGLPVWEGTTLDELSHTPPPRTRKQEMAQGLAPVFLLNGSNLEVNISRRKVIDNHALQRTRKAAEDALSELVEMTADSISPRNAVQRFTGRFKKTISSILRSTWKTILVSALLILPLEYALLTVFYKKPAKSIQRPALSMKVENNRYSGATVGTIGTSNRVYISYQPPIDTWFKLYHAEKYRDESGFVQTFGGGESFTFPQINCGENGENSMTMVFTAPEKGTILLPQPVGFILDPAGVTLDGTPLSSRYRPSGSSMTTILAGGVIRYRSCRPAARNTLSEDAILRLTQLPENLSIPPSIQQELDKTIESSTDQKVDTALRLTAELLRYDDSAIIAQRYSTSVGPNWFHRVLNIGAGDCDVLNSMTILLLRKMGIPARLVVGLIGEKGKILPGMHAWTEYYDGYWRSLDVSVYTPFARDTIPAAAVPPSFRRSDTVPAVSGRISMAELREKRDRLNNEKKRFGLLERLYPVLYYLSFLILFLFIVFALLTRRRPSEDSFQAKDMNRVEENLAGMALHALLHPGAWGDEAGIRHVNIIPTINGTSISLNRAIKLAKTGKLFYINRMNRLSKYVKKSSIPIMETGRPAFDPLIRLLPGVVSLNRIAALKAVKPEKAKNPAVGKLLTAVNRLISPPCLPALGLTTADFYDVDLSPLPSLSAAGIPNRFIAVNPSCPRFQSILALFEKNPRLAQFKLIKMLLKESEMFTIPHKIILQRAARRLLKEFS